MFDLSCLLDDSEHKEQRPLSAIAKWASGRKDKFPPRDFPVDVEELSDHYRLTAELPGLEKEHLLVQLDEERLIITAHRKTKAPEQRTYIRHEREEGTLRRTFDITGVDATQVTARYQEGLLTVLLPKLAPTHANIHQVEIL